MSENDLPVGYALESEFVPEAADDPAPEATLGSFFLQTVREGASVVLLINLYVFVSSEDATAFFDDMMERDVGSNELQVGERAWGRSREVDSAYREALPMSALLFQRGRVVAFLMTGPLDHKEEIGAQLTRSEILDLDGLIGIAEMQDQKIIEATAP